MGNMGPRYRHGGKKRKITKRRHGDEGHEVLAWFSDGYRRKARSNKEVMSRWLSGSFLLSNPAAAKRLPDHTIQGMTTSMAMVAAYVSSNGKCEVSISEPDVTNPYWQNEISMFVGGILKQITIESVDANEMMSASLGWINQVSVNAR
jgi:hypothetical protein